MATPKMKKEPGAWLINAALTAAGLAQKRRLDRAAKDCAAAEEATLRAILSYAKDTEWGRAHRFADILAAPTAEELAARWRQNVPPQDYEDLRPFIERHKNGEADVLFPGRPKMYATTSGTTREPKWIPITEAYYSNVYSKMTKLWLYTLIRLRKAAFWGKGFSVVGRAVECRAPDGTVCGSISGVAQRDCPEFVKKIYSAPGEVFSIGDYRARNYTLMRIGLEQDVTIVITANPSTMIELQNVVDECWKDLVEDIERGTLSEKYPVEPEIRAALAPRFRPNPGRAAELRALKSDFRTVLPRHYWPHLQILNTWHCGNTRVYTERFAGWFPEDMLHQEFSYFASECRFGVVMEAGDDTVPFPHMHYFEFVREDEMGAEHPRFLQLHELEQGGRYAVYVTTCAGLYRYNMNDLVEVAGRYGTIPTLRFVQKVNGIISMTGEKVSERQFIDAVEQAQQITGLRVRFYAGFAELAESAYHFYFDFAEPGLSRLRARDFTAVVDAALKRENEEYKAKRDSFRVKEPVGHILRAGAFGLFKARCLAQGARDGQFKMNLLMQDDKKHAMFKELVADE